MNNLRKLNEEETKEIAKELWSSQNMQQYVIDNFDFYKTKDDLILELEKVNKITIDKTMYYDDEYESPEITENNFIIYNKHNVPEHNLNEYLKEKERLQTQGCASGRYDYNGISLRNIRTDNEKMVGWYCGEDKDQYFVRYLSEEEQNDFIELVMQRQEQYLERLKKYYKRYNKHITTYGYWANR